MKEKVGLLCIAAAVFTNVAFADVTYYVATSGSDETAGGAIAASGTAVLTGCLIRRNFAYDVHGTALYLAGTAKATKCIITDNESTRNTAFSGGSGATVRVAAAGAEFSECTVTRNFSARCGAVYQSDNGIVSNCLIWGNDGCESTDQKYRLQAIGESNRLLLCGGESRLCGSGER